MPYLSRTDIEYILQHFEREKEEYDDNPENGYMRCWSGYEPIIQNLRKALTKTVKAAEVKQPELPFGEHP